MNRPTAEEIEAAKTPRGGWTRAQLAQWGVPWPPPCGWKQRLLRASTAGQAETDPPAAGEWARWMGLRSQRHRV